MEPIIFTLIAGILFVVTAIIDYLDSKNYITWPGEVSTPDDWEFRDKRPEHVSTTDLPPIGKGIVETRNLRLVIVISYILSILIGLFGIVLYFEVI